METKAVFGETCASLVQASKGGKACLGSLEPREIRDCESLWESKIECGHFGHFGHFSKLFVSEGLKSLKRCKIRPQQT